MPQPEGDRKKPDPQADSPEGPPEDVFWHRYSPHHEFSLGTASSVGVFGLAVGLIALAAVLVGLSRQDERSRPAHMDVVEIAGGGGTDGPGPEGAGPNAQGKEGRVENVAKQQAKVEPVKPKPTETLQNPVAKPLVKVETPQTKDENPAEAVAFAELRKEAERQVEASMKQAAAGPTGKKGVPNPGKGGGVGGGEGTGSGYKKGAGGGTGASGVVLAKRRRRELRWRLLFKGGGQEHLENLRAWGVTLALPTPQGSFMVMDLTRTPPGRKMENLSSHRDEIKWINQDRLSVQRIAQALGIPPPPYVVIFLPEEKENELIQLEHDYKGLDEHQIEMTEFDIRRRDDGRFVPVVINQIPRKRPF